jgi:hypothetical protein
VSRRRWTDDQTLRRSAVLSLIDTASLALEIVRPWGWNTQPLRFPTARLPAPFGARKGLSPEKTREIASPIRLRGWEPECVIRCGRRTPKSERRMGMVRCEGPALVTGGAESSYDDEICCVNARSLANFYRCCHFLFAFRKSSCAYCRSDLPRAASGALICKIPVREFLVHLPNQRASGA